VLQFSCETLQGKGHVFFESAKDPAGTTMVFLNFGYRDPAGRIILCRNTKGRYLITDTPHSLIFSTPPNESPVGLEAFQCQVYMKAFHLFSKGCKRL